MIHSSSKILKEEGFKTFFNGIKLSLLINCSNTALFFLIYERVKSFTHHFVKNPVLLPLVSSITARSFTTSFTFPLEYWKTKLQGKIGLKETVKLDFKYFFSAYLVTLQRDAVFSVTFWIIVENLRKRLIDCFGMDNHVLIPNLLAGLAGGKPTIKISKFKAFKIKSL